MQRLPGMDTDKKISFNLKLRFGGEIRQIFVEMESPTTSTYSAYFVVQ